ncbi:MAG: Zn-dependent hydrolase [Actinobacteria bacterium]|nr:Zn-dependent hydrolase [Actinomycetota bacterium]
MRPTARGVRIDPARLRARLDDLGEVSPIPGGGSCRLALTDEDRAGRDVVRSWMVDLGLRVQVDAIGNIFGTWECAPGTPVMTGSHIDTVRTGGRYDGNYGVLAGLEVIETLMTAGLTPSRPLSVAVFTNEEGARFQPDMLGSLAYVGGVSIEAALDTLAIDGARLGDELSRIGYNGSAPVPGPVPHAFIELHIEQGPLLEAEGVTIGAVDGVQGISWQEVTITGQSNHAGTTPMHLRRDPAFVAGSIVVFLRELAAEMGGNQVCTVGKIDLSPNLVNVVPAVAKITLDVRNTDEELLLGAERRISEFLDDIALREAVTIQSRRLARFEPVVFDPEVVDLVATIAGDHGHSVKRMPSGAGHDAQMLARVCPSAMIFVPSHLGISHNAAEHTDDVDLVAGANVLLDSMWELAQREPSGVRP